MSEFETGAGTKFYIGTTAAHTNQTDYEADTYVEVKQAGSIPPFGDSFAEVAFTSLGDGRVSKKKGSANAGDITVPFAFKEDDAGQIDLIEASEDSSSDDYNFKVQWSSGAVRYFSGQVASCTEGTGGADDVLMLEATIRINTPIIKVAAP